MTAYTDQFACKLDIILGLRSSTERADRRWLLASTAAAAAASGDNQRNSRCVERNLYSTRSVVLMPVKRAKDRNDLGALAPARTREF